MFLKGPDQMAAVRETSLGGDIVQVVIGEKQEIFHLVQPDELDILLAALAIVFQEHFGKIGIAHVVMVSQFFYIDILL